MVYRIKTLTSKKKAKNYTKIINNIDLSMYLDKIEELSKYRKHTIIKRGNNRNDEPFLLTT